VPALAVVVAALLAGIAGVLQVARTGRDSICPSERWARS
jgi:ABC-type branched-subunit amino acid transport system permease subunit